MMVRTSAGKLGRAGARAAESPEVDARGAGIGSSCCGLHAVMASAMQMLAPRIARNLGMDPGTEFKPPAKRVRLNALFGMLTRDSIPPFEQLTRRQIRAALRVGKAHILVGQLHKVL